MSEAITVPLESCRGIEVGGVDYDADRKGRLHVEDPKHARALRLALGDAGRIFTGFAAAPSRTCSCGFRAFRFTETCPRCGMALREPE